MVSLRNCTGTGCAKCFGNCLSRSGQLAIFVIVAIVIVAGIVIFFAVQSGLFVSSIPAEFRPVYSLYSECIVAETELALDILGTQGGRIAVDEFAGGSDFAPFSSHLSFLGIPVPYWYSVTGNNLIDENVPSLRDMEREVATHLEGSVHANCNFDEFYAQGMYIDLADPQVDVSIEDARVTVDVRAPVTVSREGQSAVKRTHEVEVASKIGKFHDIATDIYETQVRDAFLEEYAVDVMRLYAPVDGVALTCSPQIWNAQEVADELKAGLVANIGALKLSGSYYRLDDPRDEYFVVDVGRSIDENVNLLYSQNWPSKIEIAPSEGDVLIAEATGTQEGLGVLGFCYVPYHFVYDVSFPVMVQISDGSELFQYPVVVIIDNNLPRESELITLVDTAQPEFSACEFQESDVTIYTFDSGLAPVEADVRYHCLESVCDLGSTEIVDGQAVLRTQAPACLNGELVVQADGFAEKEQVFSTNTESVADVVLNREYEVVVDLEIVGGTLGDGIAVVHFVHEQGTGATALLPDQPEIVLHEGTYDVTVSVYGNSDVRIPGSTRTECVTVSRGGLAGLFGGTQEECFDIEVPAIDLDTALTGGGTGDVFLFGSDLASGRVTVSVDSLPRPSSVEELQYNYESFDGLTARVRAG